MWEITRIAQYCAVNLDDLPGGLVYNPEWKEQKSLRKSLYACPQFQGKAFPPSSSHDAWTASFSGFVLGEQHVVFTASMDYNEPSKSGPPFLLHFQPLKLEQSHRLGRRFGADRFMEILLPSPNSSNAPAFLKNDEAAFQEVCQWLTRESHSICGREWASFFIKDGGARKPVTDFRFAADLKPIFKDRIYLFAEDGLGFFSPRKGEHLPAKDESDRRTRVTVPLVLDWALNLADNGSQPALKLFQRIPLGKQSCCFFLFPTGHMSNLLSS